jgi:hypothetical protein
MRRTFSVPTLIAVLGLGGLALAQEGFIVEPVGPPLIVTVDPWGVVPLAPVFTDGIVDPWQGSHLSSRGATERSPARRRGPTDWARAIEEIIDPWAKGPLAVVTDPLIVDPWAR